MYLTNRTAGYPIFEGPIFTKNCLYVFDHWYSGGTFYRDPGLKVIILLAPLTISNVFDNKGNKKYFKHDFEFNLGFFTA